MSIPLLSNPDTLLKEAIFMSESKHCRPLFLAIRWAVRLVYPKITVVGAENLPEDACIAVGNHAQMHGPIVGELYYPRKRLTWCAAQMQKLREWYLKEAGQFAWSKAELTEKIATNAYEMIDLAIDEEVCYIERREKASDQEKPDELLCKENKIRHLIQKVRCRVYPKKEGGRRWPIMSCPIFTEKRIVFMRC